MQSASPSSQPVIGIDVPFGLNWLFFMNGRLTREDFDPAVMTRPLERWSEEEHRQWQSWRSQLWKSFVDSLLTASPPRPLLGCDAPLFESLQDKPDLRRRSREAWHDFSRWWKTDGAGRDLASRVANGSVDATIKSQLANMRESTRISIDILGLRAGQDLATSIRSNGGTKTRALVSIGLVEDAARFERWLFQLVQETNNS